MSALGGEADMLADYLMSPNDPKGDIQRRQPLPQFAGLFANALRKAGISLSSLSTF
jgi:uncharacterized protein with von Willebrand factor type A (vWA) domain